MTPKRERTEFGERLFQARTHAKLTQPQLSRAVGMAQSTLGELEYIGNGSSFTAQIAAACGVRSEWLAMGEGPMVEDRTQLPPDVAEVAASIAALPEHQRDLVLSSVRAAIAIAKQSESPAATNRPPQFESAALSKREEKKRHG